MATKRTKSELKTLDKYKIALTNCQTQPEVVDSLIRFGYTKSVIDEGWKLFNATRKAFDTNADKKHEAKATYYQFTKLRDELVKLYQHHKKLARIAFRGDQVIAHKLNLKHISQNRYAEWLIAVDQFYTEILNNNDFLEKFDWFNLTKEEFTQGKHLVDQLNDARVDYVSAKGESQNSTDMKRRAFILLDKWMKDFYAVAKIALEHNPQLLEALGVVVKR